MHQPLKLAMVMEHSKPPRPPVSSRHISASNSQSGSTLGAAGRNQFYVVAAHDLNIRMPKQKGRDQESLWPNHPKRTHDQVSQVSGDPAHSTTCKDAP